MLLIEQGPARPRSVSSEEIRAPTVPYAGCGTADAAAALLGRISSTDYLAQQALRDELTRGGWLLPTHAIGGWELIAVATRAVAARRIQLVTELCDKPIILFDDRMPGGDGLDAVGFGSFAVAAAFVAQMRADSVAAEAVQRALRNKVGIELLTYVPTRTQNGWDNSLAAAPGRVSVAPAAGWDADLVATLLVDRTLMLVPHDVTGRVFRLAWRRAWSSGGTLAPVAAPAPPPPKRTPAPPPRQELGPRSVLPAPPATVSPQAATLAAASKDGTPFCEECAKAAAARAAGAGGNV